MPTLIVLRHAKAVTEFGLPDIDRPLSGRGRRDASAVGKWLGKGNYKPDLVRCSPAKRTRQTLSRLSVDAEVGFEPDIYANDVGGLFGLLARTDERVGTLLLIGHNPSLHHLVHDLTGDGVESFPTCALAVIDIVDGWAGIRPGAGRLSADWRPKSSV
jgi:phosphohistidine phosphatase